MQKKLRFLIIDDSKMVQFAFTKLLQQAGHDATALSSCDQALDNIIELQPDCVLCDLMLPGMPGLELFTLLRNQKNIKQPAFIVISGKHFEYDRRRALEMGVDAYLTKPINHGTFLDQIISVIEEKIIVKFWGSRGTLPIPGQKSVRYGGNTNCITMHIANKHNFIFDAGTGIKELSNHIVIENKFPYQAKIFITHPHYDHISGIPFFVPLYMKGNEFEFLGPDQENITLETYLSMQMDSVYFPVNMKEFLCTFSFHSLTEETFMIDGIRVDTILLNHPGRCLGYRVSFRGKTFCYVTDNEIYLANDKVRYNQEEVDRLIHFINKTDVLVMDATYTDAEYITKINWGHSPLSSVIDVANKARVKQLYLHHHSPDQTDEDIDKKLALAQSLLEEKKSTTICLIPREGEEIVL